VKRKPLDRFAEVVASVPPVDPKHTFLVFEGRSGMRAFAGLLKAMDKPAVKGRKP